MTRIAFIGNCQTPGLRQSAEALLPDAEILSVHVSARRTPAEVRETIRGVDHVVTLFGAQHALAPLLGVEAVRELGPNCIYLPPFVFPALHLDITTLTDGSEPVRGAVSGYHSLIALAAFRLGLSADRACSLYNAHVFAGLGYFRKLDAAWAGLIVRYAEHGYDLTPHLPRWQRTNSPIMHAANHPAIVVLSTLAALALERLGLVAPGTPPPEGVADGLTAAVVQPVYPEIAHRAGTFPRMEFLRRADPSQSSRSVPLSAFVHASYDIYCDLPDRVFHAPKVSAATNALAELLSAAAYTPPRRSVSASAI